MIEKTYEGFLNLHLKQRLICSKYGIKNYTINSDGSIDVNGNVDLSMKYLTSLPLKFNRVTGNFKCIGLYWESNAKLTTLEGSPRIVGGDFLCSQNQLTSLEGAPEEVGGNFQCIYNELTSLQGAPKKVGGDFYCEYNRLTSLEGAPDEVNFFNCSNNQLKSLQGAPRKVNSHLQCSYVNQIWTFEGAPDHIGGYLLCDPPIYNVWKLFQDYSKIELFNYYDIIREVDGKPAVVLDRLNDFLEEIGKEPVKGVFPVTRTEDYIMI